MELSKAIRTGYYTALAGNVTYSSKVVPFYDAYAIPEGVSYPYVLLSSQTSVQGRRKRCKKYDASILIDIVTGSMDPIGRDQAEDIAEQIEDIVNPDSGIDLDISGNGYQLADTTRSLDYDSSLKRGEIYVFRKLMRYEHITIKL